MHFIFGVIIAMIGFTFVSKTEAYLSNFGRIAFFEKYLGLEGGSRLGYKIIGVLIIFAGILVFLNMWGGFMTWLFGPLLKHS